MTGYSNFSPATNSSASVRLALFISSEGANRSELPLSACGRLPVGSPIRGCWGVRMAGNPMQVPSAAVCVKPLLGGKATGYAKSRPIDYEEDGDESLVFNVRPRRQPACTMNVVRPASCAGHVARLLCRSLV